MNKSIVGNWVATAEKSDQATTVAVTVTGKTEEPNLQADSTEVQIEDSMKPALKPRLAKKRERLAVKESSNKRAKGIHIIKSMCVSCKILTNILIEIKDDRSPPTHVRLSDLGGADHIVAEMLELVGMPILHPEVYIHTGIQPPR